mmetsp:Transcript_2706/g.3537  ORF Transcript_2706/g.3537 Transcript_2706/m.3537 type:complete len:668 (+) Transcript_2706:67-2070(+)
MMRFSSSYGNMWMCFWGLLFCTIAGTTTTLAETQNSIVDIAENDGEGRFTTLVSLLDTTNLKPVLEDHAGYNSFFCNPESWFYISWLCPTYTVFAPTNEAFEQALTANDALEKMVADTDDNYNLHLQDVLKYHVLEGTTLAAQIESGQMLETLSPGNKISAVSDGSNVVLDGSATVIDADLVATNGVVHVIGQVLASPPSVSQSIVDIAQATPDLSSLVQALTDTDLVSTLADEKGTFTVFAPTNQAFEALTTQLQEDGVDLDTDTLTQVLLYHVHAGAVVSLQDLVELVLQEESNKISIDTVQGAPIHVGLRNTYSGIRRNHKQSWYKRFLQLNDQVNIVTYDILASNGIIHVIDTVLLIPEPQPTIVGIAQSLPDQFSTLVRALEITELDGVLNAAGNDDANKFTVFAPTNDAFEGIDVENVDQDTLKNILLYHVNSGTVTSNELQNGQIVRPLFDQAYVLVKIGMSGTWWNPKRTVHLNSNVHVTQANIEASNGIIHVIDKVLIPPDNIATVVDFSDDFSILKQALTDTGLLELFEQTMSSEENEVEGPPYTVLAPTDAAFAKLGDALNSLTLDDLKDILTYHVIPGRIVPSAVLRDEQTSTYSTALVSKSVEIMYQRTFSWSWFSWAYEDFYYVNTDQAQIEKADILASNGIVHVIDSVLIPP